MVNQSVLDSVTKYLQQIPKDLEVRKAFLFGSFAQGVEHEGSDIDIAIVIGNMTDFFTTQMQLMRIRRKVDLRIEPHLIDEADFTDTNPFAYEVKHSGIELPT